MTVKFSQVFTRGDKIKIGILLAVAALCWVIVWKEYKKPLDFNWQEGMITHGSERN